MEWKKYFLFSNNEHNVLAIHSDIGLMGFYIKIFFYKKKLWDIPNHYKKKHKKKIKRQLLDLGTF